MYLLVILIVSRSIVKEALAVCPLTCNCTKINNHNYNVNCKVHSRLPIMPLEMSAKTIKLKLELQSRFIIESVSFRHFKRLETLIVISGGHTLNIDDGAFIALHELLSLKLIGRASIIINTYSFSGLCSLNNLSITGFKNLSNLPDMIFASLRNLKHLDISDNNISIFQEHLFANLKALTHLNFSKNNLSFLHPNLLQSLTRLQQLQGNSNYLRSIKDGFFSTNKDLVYLSLHGNSITTLNSEAFQSLSKLIYLDMHNNSIKSMSKTALSALRQLEYFYVNGNELPCSCEFKDMLNQMRNLRELRADCIYNDEVINMVDLDCSSLNENFGEWKKVRNLEKSTMESKDDSSKEIFGNDFAISFSVKFGTTVGNLTVKIHQLSYIMTSERVEKAHAFENISEQALLSLNINSKYCFQMKLLKDVWNTVKIIKKNDVIYTNTTSPMPLNEYLTSVENIQLFRKVQLQVCQKSEIVSFIPGLIKNMVLYTHTGNNGVIFGRGVQKEQCRVVLVKWEKVIVLMSASLALLVIILLVVKCLYNCHGRETDTRPRQVNSNNSSI